jgi:hypothetical protein
MLSFGMLCSVKWQFHTDISVQTVSHNFKGYAARPKASLCQIAKQHRSHLHVDGSFQSSNIKEDRLCLLVHMIPTTNSNYFPIQRSPDCNCLWECVSFLRCPHLIFVLCYLAKFGFALVRLLDWYRGYGATTLCASSP